MKIRWEPRLKEELVRAESRRDKAFGDTCRHHLEPVYDLTDDEREAAFAVAYGDLFEERRLAKGLEALLEEFSLLGELEEVLVFRTTSRREEGTELGRSRTKMGIRLRAERLGEPEYLEPFLRHEFMHISDMLDPAFGYRDELLRQFEERLVPRRYQVLWDTCIDGRLERDNHPHETTQQQRQVEFERLFSFLPRRQRAAAFHHLWNSRDTTHAELMKLAEEPAGLALLATDGEETPLVVVPGTLCPLCKFPTFDWADPTSADLPVIQGDFPTWTLEEGICSRCYEYYQTRVEGERVAS